MAIISRGGRGRGYRKQQFTDINVTPMVDVMLVLLVIFMVTAPMLTAGVQVDLPESAAAPLKGDDEPISVTVSKDGSVSIQETPIKVDELQAKLKAVAGNNAEARIFVRGDKDIDYGRMMQVVGEVNAAGFHKVALVTIGQKGKK